MIQFRTLALTDMLALSIFALGVEHLRAAARAGDAEAATEVKAGMRDLGLIDPDRIEPVPRGATGTRPGPSLPSP